jgi:hypothetical protein
MIVDGRGAPGFVKATAAVRLTPEGEGTRVFYDTDAQIGGKIASVGQRLLEASARAIVAQSLEGLHANIKLRAAAYREAAAKQAIVSPAAEAPVAALPAAAPPVTAPAAEHVPVPAADAAEPASQVARTSSGVARPAGTPVDPAPPAAPAAIAFTPVKVKQSALANAVAKEVASSLFPRSVLVAIIVIQAAVIVWLLLR